MTVECKFYGIVNFVVRDVVITKVALYIGNIFRKGVILVGGDKVGMEAVLHMKVDIGSDVIFTRYAYLKRARRNCLRATHFSHGIVMFSAIC